MILTGEDKSTGRKTSPMPLCPQLSHMEFRVFEHGPALSFKNMSISSSYLTGNTMCVRYNYLLLVLFVEVSPSLCLTFYEHGKQKYSVGASCGGFLLLPRGVVRFLTATPWGGEVCLEN
jgi:hypothetical protein